MTGPRTWDIGQFREYYRLCKNIISPAAHDPVLLLTYFSLTSCLFCTMWYRLPFNYLFIRPPSGLRDRLRDNYASADRRRCTKSDRLPGPCLNPANTQAFHPPPSKPLTAVLAPRFSFLHTFFHCFLRPLFWCLPPARTTIIHDVVIWRVERLWPSEYTHRQRQFFDKFWQGRLNKYD